MAELEQSLSEGELNEWMEYYMLEPFGSDRNELQMAQLTSLVLSMFGNTGHNYKDFMVVSHQTAENHPSMNVAQKLKNIFGID